MKRLAGLCVVLGGLGCAAEHASEIPAPEGPSGTATGPAQPGLAPLRVGDVVDVRVRGPGSLAAGQTDSTRVSEPGAYFIKLHFDHVELQPGDELLVTDAEGRVVDGLHDSASDWWAVSVDSDTAFVTIVAGDTDGRRDFLVDRVGVGTVAPQEPERSTRSICGGDDKQPAACFGGAKATAAAAVGRMRFSTGSGMAVCTGSLVSAEGHFITNNHCIASQADMNSLEVKFNYQTSACDDETPTEAVVTSGGDFVKTSSGLDYTLVQLPNNPAEQFGFLQMDPTDDITVGTGIYIAQHPGGRLKEIATEDSATGQACSVRSLNESIGNYTSGANMGYTCDTEGGSSGSPVLRASNNKIVAIHHLGGCNNSGTYVRNIYPEIAQYLGEDPAPTPGPDPDPVPVPGPDPVPVPGVTTLVNGQPFTGLAGIKGAERHFVLAVPAGATNLKFQLSGGSGDADVYVRKGAQPTTSSYDHRPYLVGNNETINATASAGNWYVMVRAYAAYSGATLEATFDTPSTPMPPGGGDAVLVSGEAVEGLSGAAGSERVYSFEVPPGTTNLDFSIAFGSGDCDLYVKKGSPPTRTSYDYRPFRDGNNETVNATPTAGTWYVMLRGYRAYSGVTLIATAE